MSRKKENKKIILLQRLVKMAKVDNVFKKEEYKYLRDLADSLGIKRSLLKKIIATEIQEKKGESLRDRAKQLYRLAIMMLIDGVIAPKEMKLLKEYTIELGFNPIIIDTMLYRMEQNKGGMLFEKELLEIFNIQNN